MPPCIWLLGSSSQFQPGQQPIYSQSSRFGSQSAGCFQFSTPPQQMPTTSFQSLPLRPSLPALSGNRAAFTTTFRSLPGSCLRPPLAGSTSSQIRPAFTLNASKRVQRPSWMAERHSTFKKKSKKVKLSMWEHEFICLSQCGETTPPTPMDKANLIRAGLGPRKLSLFEFGDSAQFHDDMIAAFPKLREGGGYELMRTQQNNNRELCVIPSLSGGYTAEYLKAIVGQAKVYIRPIQQDLSTSPMSDDSEVSVSRNSPLCTC